MDALEVTSILFPAAIVSRTHHIPMDATVVVVKAILKLWLTLLSCCTKMCLASTLLCSRGWPPGRDGRLVSQVGHQSPGIDDPNEMYSYAMHRTAFLNGLIDVGFESIRNVHRFLRLETTCPRIRGIIGGVVAQYSHEGAKDYKYNPIHEMQVQWYASTIPSRIFFKAEEIRDGRSDGALLKADFQRDGTVQYDATSDEF